MSPSPVVNRRRFRLVSFCAAAFFAAAFVSQARVQTVGSGGIQEQALKSKRFVVTQRDAPQRGRILSADGKVLARDEGVYALHVDFNEVPQTQAFYIALGEATGMSGMDVRDLATRAEGRVLWPASLSAEQRRRVLQVKTKWRANGISADPTGRRFYPLGSSASSIVGLAGNAATAKGIEKALSDEISGQEGISRGLVDRSGAFLPMRMQDDSIAKIDGADVVLTINSSIQTVAHDALRRAVESNKASSGIAIVMDPKTGDVLAMANWPTFDPKSGQGPDGKPADFNQNVMGRFEPGSTMKILTQAKALQDGKVGTGWSINCGGTLVKGPYRISCDHHGGTNAHGHVDMEKAIAESCNVSAAQWACEIGFDNYHQFMKDLGLLSKTETGLPGETMGQVFIEPVAKTHELMCWGFGQSMAVTPLALGSAFTAFGNDGVWMQPRLVKSIGGQNTPIRKGNAVFSRETTEQVMRYMEAVFNSAHGTGKSLRIPGYRLAGKTGTAERKGRVGGGYVANFVGLLPADKPEAMVLVMIDRPSGGRYYGGTVAGPVFKEIALAVIRELGISPSSGKPEPVNDSPTSAQTGARR